MAVYKSLAPKRPSRHARTKRSMQNGGVYMQLASMVSLLHVHSISSSTNLKSSLVLMSVFKLVLTVPQPITLTPSLLQSVKYFQAEKRAHTRPQTVYFLVQ